MHNSDVNLENSRSSKPLRPGGHPGFGQGVSAAAREKELQRLDGMKIAQSAVEGIGMSTKEIRGSWMNNPNYALAVSMLFTRATNQSIILGTPPDHVLSTSILYSCLLHDSRFREVPMSDAVPGDIIIASHPNQADGYAGIVVDHRRIVSDSSNGVQNDSSLVEIQRSRPAMAIFRYIGVQGKVMIDTDGSGPDNGDPDQQPHTSYPPKGASLNADTTTYAVAPSIMSWDSGKGLSILKGGERVTITSNGKTVEGVVGDFGPNEPKSAGNTTFGEVSFRAVRGLGIPIARPTNNPKTDD